MWLAESHNERHHHQAASQELSHWSNTAILIQQRSYTIFFSLRIFTRMWPLSHTFIHIRVDRNTMRIKSLIIKSSDHSTFATSQLAGRLMLWTFLASQVVAKATRQKGSKAMSGEMLRVWRQCLTLIPHHIITRKLFFFFFFFFFFLWVRIPVSTRLKSERGC